VESGCQGVAFHREFPVPGDVVLPGQGQHALKQRLKIRRGEGAQLHQYPRSAAEVQIQPGNVKHIPFTVDAAVFGPDIV
jgi:hypothetical protein